MWQRIWWRLVRVGFDLLYNQMAWTYDAVSWLASLGQWRSWQRSALPFLGGTRVLEIAHGPGHMLLALARAGYEPAGVDLSPAMGKQASRRLRRTVHPPPLVRARAQALPFAPGSFDSVLSTFPTDFIAAGATMASVHRVLRPHGRLVIVPEGHLRGRGPLISIVNWLYVITGQRDDDFAVDENRYWPERSPRWHAFRRQIESVGFGVTVHHLTLPRSGVTVVVAERD